ncbi:MAG: hypothetical protein HY302_09585 [Opitutae bacterium]|nr:hypothetical protein [Opitutae bacterium]
MILYCILTSAINAATSAVLALAVYLRRSRTAASGVFVWFAISVAVWSVSYFLWQTAVTNTDAYFYCRLLTAAAITIPVVYFHFATVLLGRQRSVELRAGYVLALVFSILALWSPWVVAGVAPKAEFSYWPMPGPIYPAYLLVFFYCFVVPAWMLVSGFRQARGLRRNQLGLVTLGTAVGFIGGATNFFLWYDIPIPPIGNGLVAVYVVAVGYAIIRFRLMDFDLLVARFVVYSGATLLLALLTPTIFSSLNRWSLTPTLALDFPTLYLASVVSTALLVWLLPELRRRIDSFLEQRVLGRRLADRELLRSLAATISSSTDESALFDEAVDSVAEAIGVPDVAVYTRTEFETDFTRRAVTPAREASGSRHFAGNSPVVRLVQEAQRGVILDEVLHGAVTAERDYFVELRHRQGFELIVPVVGDTFFYGFMTLGPRSGRALYNDIDVSLLEAIGLQIGLNLRARQLERRASQTEKLIALGTLAAGLAHELRNPLVSIQTFSALLKERGADPDFQLEFGSVVQRDVNRIASIVENVAAFAESNKVEMTVVNLPDVLRTVSEIVRPELQRTGIELTLPVVTHSSVRGNYSQLLQVFLNLVQNALQALEGQSGGVVRIGLDLRLTEGQPPLVCVSVNDNGPGIDAAMCAHIFEPFTTTKATGQRQGKHGMGLGLAIVKRIVQHHHGDIDVQSAVGRGTTFRVHLPQSR